MPESLDPLRHELRDLGGQRLQLGRLGAARLGKPYPDLG